MNQANETNEKSVFRTNSEKIGYIFLVLVAFIIGLSVGLVPSVRSTTQTIRENASGSLLNVLGKIMPDSSNKIDKSIDFSFFWEIWDTVSTKYVDSNISSKTLFYGAIKGMVSSLQDPVTVFLTPEETQAYENGNKGEFEGIGAELGYKDNAIVIVTPLEGSPAKAAGVKAGDIIVKVNGESTVSKSILDVVMEIRGKAGTEVNLTLSRKSQNKLFDVKVTRQKIAVSSMTYKEADKNGIAVIQVSRFTESSLAEWKSAWDKQVEKIIADNPKGLVIDLRGNPGGYFSGAVYMASDFLKNGQVVVKQQDRDQNTQEYLTDHVGKLQSIPVVVLVNEGSASASEIFAGALQKNLRAKIVGVNSYGKGTAQDVIDYPDGSSLHITVYKWLLPDGKWLNPKDPIIPDVKVEMSEEDYKLGKDTQLEEAIKLLQK